MMTKPWARLNVVTEPEPLPIGYAVKLGESSLTRPTRRYSVRPRSDVTLKGIRACTMEADSGGRPARRRITGATNSRKVKMADVGNPGSTTTGTGRRPGNCTTARQSGLPGLRATP